MQTYTQQFITKNEDKLCSEFDETNRKCSIYSTSDSDLQKCGEIIRQGKLVGFPTNTVYGLGADATNETAIRSIYAAKGRPLTDPVIVHISDRAMVEKIADKDQDKGSLEILDYLGENLWPGPITFIVKANLEYIPAVVTANTGYVGIRFPSNEIAQKLIAYAGTPICAPSANRFAHISPTSAVHVFNDLFDKEVALIDGPNAVHGLESTVVKIICNKDEKTLYVLRHGSVPTSKIRQLVESNARFSGFKILEKEVEKSEGITKNMEAPGQL